MAYCCPKSIKACAFRLTKELPFGVSVDPLAHDSRVLSSGFVELTLTPEYLTPEQTVTRADGGQVMIVDRDFGVLVGLSVTMKVCGLPLPALEMLIDSNPLMAGGDVTGMALKDDKRFACQDPVMLEVWSKNADHACPPGGISSSGQWIHWVLPRVSNWELDGDLAFNNGALEVTLKGYATQNPFWFPSNPDPAAGLPSYVPGDGDPAGVPTGAAPTASNPGMSYDEWTSADVATIRDSGPLAWKCVAQLPSPLDACGYVAAPCVDTGYVVSMIGSGALPSPPWSIPGAFA